MPRFSANLSTLFQELPLVDRFRAAADCGFEAVELWFPYEIPASELASILAETKLSCVGLNAPPGDTRKGDWGIAIDPDRRKEFIAGVEMAMSYAETINCPNVHVLAGNRPEHLDAQTAGKIYKDGIATACAVAKRHGRRVLIEPLNAIDRPTYFLSTQRQAIETIGTLRCDNLAIMLDLFHLQRGEGNLIERMRGSLPYAAHVQLADCPGRHEPGTGEINYPAVLAELNRLGYRGWVGCEYFPSTFTKDSFRWLEGSGGSPGPAR
jgi:hydroxypyruvate isomerase